MTPRHPTRPLDRPPRPLPGRPDDRRRRLDRERRPAVDRRRSRLLRDLARLGGERVPADLRRLPAARRPARRPVRAAPAVPARDRALHRRLDRLRSLDEPGDAGRRARGAGARRRGRLGGRALADHGPLHRSRRAREGARRVRVLHGRRRQHRRAARRRPHRPPELALDLPRQRPDRDRRRHPDEAADPGDAGRGERAASTSPARSRSPAR